MSAENDAAVWEHMQKARAKVVREALREVAMMPGHTETVHEAFAALHLHASDEALRKLGRLLK